MKSYIKNILPRLQQFSKSLDLLTNFTDKSWIYIDEDGNRHTNIFQANKSLIMSLNGKVQMGSWSYIPSAESILIDRVLDLSKSLIHFQIILNITRPFLRHTLNI